MNYETFKACDSILQTIERFKPSKVRDALFTFLEKFTNNLYTDEAEFSSGKGTQRTSGGLTSRNDDEFKLPEVKEPFLPPPSQTFTLVLDLDETLIHFIEFDQQTAAQKAIYLGKGDKNKNKMIEEEEFGGHFLIRPGAREFLAQMSICYEVVIFTAAMQDYADWVIDHLDTGKWIKHRLYRQHACREGPVFIKDLSKLGRQLNTVIIVDNVYQNF